MYCKDTFFHFHTPGNIADGDSGTSIAFYGQGVIVSGQGEHKMSVLLIHSDIRFMEPIEKSLETWPVELLHTDNGEDAMRILARHGEIEVVILEVDDSGGQSMDLLRSIKARYPLVEVLMLTEASSMEWAVEGMRLGAADYLMKDGGPVELAAKIREAAEKKRRHEEKIIDARTREMASRST